MHFVLRPQNYPMLGCVRVGDDMNFCLVFPTQSICAFLHLANDVTFLQFQDVWLKVFRHALRIYFPTV
jgi:hypothetical protein